MKYLTLLSSFYLIFMLSGCGGDSGSSFDDASTGLNIKIGNLSLSVDSNASIGTLIGTIPILNSGSSSINSFELYGINANFFNISNNGQISLSSEAQFNVAVKNLYLLEAIAKNTSERSNRASISISLDSGAVARMQNFSNNIDENATAGTLLGSITLLENGASITAITLSGNGESDFNVDASGQITLSPSANLNFGTKDLYTLQAIATNAAGNSDPITISISVNNPNIVINSISLVLIAISFNNFPILDTELNWHKRVFGNSPGEINHYYKEISNGTFSLTPAQETKGTLNDGIIKVSLGINHPGNNGMTKTHLSNAISLADSFIDFSTYDKNSNGHIEIDELQIMFIVGGGETAFGDPVASSTWAHASGLSPAPLHDGVSVMSYFDNGGYSRFGEKQGNHFATIGVIVHELGHAMLKIPDLYDRTSPKSGAIGAFGLMASGSWAKKSGEFSGQTPTHMSAWSKIKANFISPIVINVSANNISMFPTHNNNNNIIKIPTNDPNEYFLIENRSPLGYDAGLYRLDGTPFLGGLAIWHIDDAQISSQNDNVNRKLVDLEEANNPELDLSSSNNGTLTNLFYAGNKTLFDNTTFPNSKKYDGSSTNISVNNISSIGNAGSDYIMSIDISK
ncbi:MAG: hypothetical protein COA44_03820 [Arcobacter sp.]|nr:MAG: hypothetical protein COA44_03820 [Arcobacter sp.]